MARKSEIDTMLAKLDAEMAKLQEMRDYLTSGRAAAAVASKPKRTRKAKAAKGEPEL